MSSEISRLGIIDPEILGIPPVPVTIEELPNGTVVKTFEVAGPVEMAASMTLELNDEGRVLPTTSEEIIEGNLRFITWRPGRFAYQNPSSAQGRVLSHP